jgi:adenosylcobinamide-phosphate guanylyltransferase
MCGGRGSRLSTDDPASVAHDTSSAHNELRSTPTGTREKPLVPVGGIAMLDRVVAAVRASRVERVHLVGSPHAPVTRDRARALAARLADCAVVDAPGEGYVADLNHALAVPAVDRPVVTAVADLPLLAPGHVDDAARTARDGAPPARPVTVAVPAGLKRLLGASTDATFELEPGDTTVVRDDEGHGDGDPVAPDSDSGLDDRMLAPTGLNVVAAGADAIRVVRDPRLAINVNRPPDLALARARAPPIGETPWLDSEIFGS